MNDRDDRAIGEKYRRLLRGESLRVLDLFSGCGGMSLGFQRAGAEILAGLEIEPQRAQTHARNFHRHLGERDEQRHARPHDITALEPRACLDALVGRNRDVDVIVGGPPCQAYARVGRAKLREIAQHPEAYLHDDRGQLYAAYIRYVEQLQPVVIVMENVPDILSYGGDNVAELAAVGLEELGYVCRYTLLNAANYGVPQTRERWYMIGVHRSVGALPCFPAPTHHVVLPSGYAGTRSRALKWETDPAPHCVPLRASSPSLPPAVTCEEALSDLPVISNEEKLALKRGARDLTARRPYRWGRPNRYQHIMRAWSGGQTMTDVSAHVIRALPRDYDIFREMREGDDYPAAHAIGEARFERALMLRRLSGERIPDGGVRWKELRHELVPPYDPTKFPNKWRKLERHFPSRTLMAHLSHDTYSHIHYDSEQARTISVREAARLQSFPDSFEFSGAMNAAFGQIGNAVPPLMAFALAEQIFQTLGLRKTTPLRIASGNMG